MVKLFVTDLDGTLLPDGCDVPAANIEAAKKAVEAGVIVTIATGRMYRAALPVAKALDVDVPIITYNGAMIKTTGGKLLYSNYIAPETVLKVLDFCQERGWYAQLYSHDTLYFPVHNEKAQTYERLQKVTGNTVGWDGMREHTDAVSKLLLVSDSLEETEERIAAVKKYFGNELAPFVSNAHYAEVVNIGVNKAAGVKNLAKVLGIDIADTMAIGDANNDLPMLKAAGKSIAMGNAVPEVKAVCDYETGNCEDNGWAQAVYRYVLPQK